MPARIRRNRHVPLAPALAVVLLLMSSAGCSYAPEPAPTQSTSPAVEALDRAARHALRSGGSGVAIHAQWPGMSWEHAYGVRMLDGAEPAQPGDAVVPGSLLQTWVAVSALKLVEEGRLALDAPVDDRLEAMGLKPPRTVTLRELLAQTSGIPGLPQPREWTEDVLETPLTLRDVVAQAAGQPWNTSMFGSFGLTDTSFAAVALIVEELRGKPIAEVFREDIVRPLGLSGTTFGSQPKDGLLHGYAWIVGQRVDLAGSETTPGLPGGAAVTARDMATFTAGLLSGKLLKPESLAEMRKTGSQGYGLGLWTASSSCGKGVHYGQRGDALGYASVVMASADGTRSVAIATSAPVVDPGDEPSDARQLYGDQLWSAAQEFLDRSCPEG